MERRADAGDICRPRIGVVGGDVVHPGLDDRRVSQIGGHEPKPHLGARRDVIGDRDRALLPIVVPAGRDFDRHPGLPAVAADEHLEPVGIGAREYTYDRVMERPR